MVSKGKNDILLFLAESGAAFQSIKVTTTDLARRIGMSQQTASRLLIQLEREGYIERRIVGRETHVRLKIKGIKELMDLYLLLKGIFERPITVKLKGSVFSGLGEGAYYLSIPNYLNQIKEKVGFEPYLGTLNVKLSSIDDLRNKMLLEKIADIRIEGFKDEKRSYGGARCIKALFNGVDECAIMFIERTHHGTDVIEIISPEYLRGKYNLKDGDKVSIIVNLQSITFLNHILNSVDTP